MRNFVFLVIAGFLGIYGNAQDVITGSIPNWANGSGQVGVMSMGPPEVVGTFDADGNIEIPLKADALSEIKAQLEASESDSSNGWTASIPTVGERFACGGQGAELNLSGSEELITGLGGAMGFLLVNMEERKRYGYLLIASSQEFAEGLQPYKFKPGYALGWYYVDNEASAVGTCTSESYAMNQEDTYRKSTTYQVNLKKGWNIVKYEIEEVFTDKEGNSYPQKESYTTLESMPEGVGFVFLED
ncbi:hypothetical protein [Robiginitalea sediminis]|uniref:hypothetical protein n=1 Tax=Robiginitalea sediminis TaxID=1982593 RepID=UPI000B4B8BF6|nr:hypothetical protein [Robiginitalea sediminis]